MATKTEQIKNIIILNGGEVVGKTRLQKTLYFLEVLHVGLGFDFDYYHYGPYSDEVSTAVDDAKALGLINEQWREGAHLRSYAILRANFSAEAENAEQQPPERSRFLRILARYDAITLEIAATADFLSRIGYGEHTWEETVTRKPSKASPHRIEKAKELLMELGIPK